MRTLIVEDVDQKFDDICDVVRGCLGEALEISRATHLNSAEDLLTEQPWDLLLLDLSMDITESKSFDFSSGHATLGGLDVLERMALLKIALPTVLVTGFDSFQDTDRFQNAITYLKDIERLSLNWLGESYLGYVRYGPEGWDKKLRIILTKRWGR